LVAAVQKLLEKKKYIIVAGLAMTFDRQPFVPMPQLLAMADKVNKLNAICSLCGKEAVYHKKINKESFQVSALKPDRRFVAHLDASIFQARCRNCFSKKP